MKKQKFFCLALQEVFGVNESKAIIYLSDFAKSFRHLPQISESLEKDVTDSNGVILQDTDIALIIEKLKLDADSTTFFKGMVLHGVNFLNLYLKEMHIQLQYAKKCYKDYLIAKDCEKVEEVFYHIHHFVIHTSNVDKLLDKLMPKVSTSFKEIVSNLLKSSVDLTDVDLKSFRPLRNHLEHFEERLDAWFYLYEGGPFLDMNLANSKTKGLPEERCLRLIRTDENIFIVLGERFDLTYLYTQVRLLAQRLSDYLNSKFG